MLMKSPPGEKTGARTATAADKSSGESARGRQGMTHVLSSFRTASRGGSGGRASDVTDGMLLVFKLVMEFLTRDLSGLNSFGVINLLKANIVAGCFP